MTREQHSHLTKRRRTYFARLNVPKDVQPLIGRKIFIASTHESDLKRANAVAAPMVAEWQHRIDQARAGKSDPVRTEIDRLASEYHRTHKTDPDGNAGLLVSDVLGFVFQRLGGMTAAQQRQALLNARGDVAEAMKAMPASATTAFEQIMGYATPILAHLDAWKAATHLKGKTLDQVISDINQFAKAVDQPLERLSGKHVQGWIEGLLNPKSGNTVAAVTVRRKLTALRTYWVWLHSHELVSSDQHPFTGRKVNEHKTAVEKAEELRLRFEPADVVWLWREAEAKGDQALAAAIKIAAYTGARREGVSTLTVKSIRHDPASETDYFHFAEKTGNGVRDVPVHPELKNLITHLSGHADQDGYLIPSSNKNKYSKRGDALGKRFTRLKQELGFGEQHVFHSLRHTVIYLYRKAECPVEIRNQIVGHADDDVGAGYGGVIDMRQKLAWLTRAIIYPTSSKS